MNEVDPIRTLSAPVSVVILTLNEQINIGACLDSCAWCDDVHVLDSGSTDQTRAIAEERGARTHVNPFTSFGAQRNWAIDHIPTRHEWIFHLDADERFTPELVRAMDDLLRRDPPEAGFHVPSKLMFMGRWLRRAGGYPTYQMRLFHKHRMRFSDYGHGQRELTTGAVGTLDVPYLHFNFSKGLVDWFERHNRYSSLEAREALAERGEPARLGDVLAGGVARRRAIKRLTRRMPFRPALRWLYTMIAQGAVLEGRAGRTYAGLLATYERMINLKLAELEHQQRSTPNGAHSAGRENRSHHDRS
jgi:glycosyltransferase involved in cell wall biosynthesis